MLERVTVRTLVGAAEFAEELRRGATPLVQTVLDEIAARHDELYGRLASSFAALLTHGEDERRQLYGRYLVQLWYHTSFAAEFSRRFGEKLAHLLDRDPLGLGAGKNLLRRLFEASDEETGRELWALQDLAALGGVERIDLRRDVLPETRALVRVEFDRLERLEFKGFLGSSLYMGRWLSSRAVGMAELMTSLKIPDEAMTYAKNHALIERPHALEEIEVANVLIREPRDVEEMLDHVDIVHCLYARMATRSLRP